MKKKGMYVVEIYRGFIRETENGYEMPELISAPKFDHYDNALGFYKAHMASKEGTARFYNRDGSLRVFKTI